MWDSWISQPNEVQMSFNDALRNDPDDQDPQDVIEGLKVKLQESYQRFERLRPFAKHKEGCARTQKIDLGYYDCECGLLKALR